MMVRLSRLDHMLELAGEVIIVSSNLNSMSRQVSEGATVSRDLAEDVKDLAITSSRISGDLHKLVSEVRTVDMGDLFARFRRLARDVSRRLGKTIRFTAEGENICIDKKISEMISDPIAHQIRNAIDHGIEDKETRAKLGKDPVGTISIRIRESENNTVIDVIDDGRGIDMNTVRQKVVEKGLASADAAAGLADEDLFEYLYLPGFSTAAQTSVTSGRGVGMDVIRTALNEIGGETRIQTEPGKGTRFSFILPNVTAVNIADALLVRADRTRFAFPILSVLASQSIPRSAVTNVAGGGRSITYLGSILPLFDLMKVFGEQPVDRNGDGQLRVLIVECKHRRVAYLVSDFLSPQKIVISEVDGVNVPGILGTAILSGRQMCMVVDLPRLFERTLGGLNGGGVNALAQAARNAGVVHAGAETEATPHEAQRESEKAIASPEQVISETGQATAGDREGLALALSDSEFLQELNSMLTRLNRELLTLEEKRDSETADSVFRLVHSIKGNLTMTGADEPASIAHQVETILERARRKVLTLEDNAFDLLFDSSAYLEEVVKALLKKQKAPAPPDRILSAVKRLREPDPTASSEAMPAEHDAQVVLDPTGEFYLSSRRRDGAALFQCRIAFDPGDQPAFLVAYLILRRIQSVADVLGSLPTMAEIEAGVCDKSIVVLFAPRDPRPDLIERLRANLERYYGVSSFQASTYA
ncbi:MAG: chemotaxis protein CheW [Phycisphaerae bacterium]|nr:chemotaxis protein CheW [Phycisphaerae bacterium]